MTLAKQLYRYQSSLNEPTDTVSKVLNFLSENETLSPNCFERELEQGHFTASGFIIRKKSDKIETLLTHHAKLNLWIQPGGHADGCQDLLHVAKTEVKEETGLECELLLGGEIFDIDVHDIPQYKGISEHKHYDVRYLFKCDTEQQYQVSHESHDLAWIELSKIFNENHFDPSVKRMARKAHALFS